MVDNNFEEVWRRLGDIANHEQTSPTGERMVLDPNTGELINIQDGGSRPEGSVDVDSSAENGFFGT
jgi:hypothetical protein